MANFCLMPDAARKFKQGLVDGTLNPERLADMSSEARNELFGQFVGPNNAKAVNSAFESKLLLKNQKQGFLTWAKQVSGVKPNVRRDLVAKIERMQNVLDPAEHEQFMKDLTATRLGVDVTQGEAKKIADLSKKVTDFEALRRPDNTFANKEQRLNYGRSVEDLTDYVAGLKTGAEKFKAVDLKGNPVSLLKKFTSKASGNMKSLSASMDNSAVFRQGWKPMFTNPVIWAKNATNTFSAMAKTVGGKNVLREVNADIISRPNYDRFIKGGLAIKKAEEAFPESLAEKVPALGRLYKASEAAYTGFQYRNRADIADKMLDIAKRKGIDINDKTELKAIMNVVNSLTGRGNLGALEKNADTVNNIFFSPRYLKSSIDTFTQPLGAGGAKTAFARRQAQKNLAKVVGGTFAVLAAANALNPGSVEWDPRSSDFGKVKVGDTRFDATGGLGSLITFLARETTGKSKSSSTGRLTSYTSGDFGAPTRLDALVSYFTNKVSPAARIGVDKLKGKDFDGNPFNLATSLKKSVIPIGVQNWEELKNNPRAANTVLGVILDGLGISANTYSASNKTSQWQNSDSKTLKAFKAKAGETQFNAAAKKYDNDYNNWFAQVQTNDTYKKMSDDDKAALQTKKKAEVQKDIFKQYGFKYKNEKKKKVDTSLL